MSESLKEYCVRYDRLELLAQWHPEKNGDLTPEKITSGSQKKVWWRCNQGHEWMSQPYERAKRGTGCPYCAGKRIMPGMDLAAMYPYLASQWHPQWNGELGPENVLPGSHQSVWWKCSEGHEWRAEVYSRVNGRGCPICTGRVVVAGQNDLETVYPTLAMQWHPERNGVLDPSQVIGGSKRRVWWRCERGHEWQASIKSRTQGAGCPVCAGKVVNPGENDLNSFSPDLAEQWNWEKNGTLRPEQVSVFCNKKVWWKCGRGHEWKAVIYSRTGAQKCGCPVCAGKTPRIYK